MSDSEAAEAMELRTFQGSGDVSLYLLYIRFLVHCCARRPVPLLPQPLWKHLSRSENLGFPNQPALRYKVSSSPQAAAPKAVVGFSIHSTHFQDTDSKAEQKAQYISQIPVHKTFASFL